MNNLLSYFGLVNAKIRASDKDLPVNKLSRKKFVEKFVRFGICTVLSEINNSDL